VDLAAIRHNAEILRPAGVELMAVVKANAYGHGDVPVAKAALEAGATWLGVALVEEGLSLREAGIEAPILVLSELPGGAEREALTASLTPSLYSDAGLARLAEAAAGERVRVHVKVDTGMHRVGVWPPEDAVAFLGRVTDHGLEPEGLWTHFARSEEDEATTKAQVDRFAAIIEAARDAGFAPRYLHASNSAAVLRHPEACFDLIRPGIALYGVEPVPGVGASLGLRSALAWMSEVSMVKRLRAGERVSYGHSYELARDAWVATVPVGYADGYPRQASSRADVLIRGARCRVAGNVTMDQMIVDCGDLEVEQGDEVVLIGRQGDEEVTAWELAGHAGTIAYEILVRISDRVPREHL
jgi:alanine racemase